MSKETPTPIFSDEFLTQVAEEINQQYGLTDETDEMMKDDPKSEESEQI
jgi:hypothetical protein